MSAQRNAPKFARILGGILVVLVCLVAWNWSTIQAKYTAHRLRSAETPEARVELAKALMAHGLSGRAELVNCTSEADERTGPAIGKVLAEQASQSPNELASQFLPMREPCTDAGRLAILSAIPAFLKSENAEIHELCRKTLEQNLKGSPEVRAMAASLAGRPSLRMLPSVLPLLDDPEAVVREAAMKAVGTAGDSTTVTDEELFRWLNDTDEKVRSMCEAVLIARGRSQDEIDFGRQLAHPNPRVRLQLLVDLASDPQRDIGPWLERLSRDREPAVRAGAVRVACERRILYAEWADKLAANDPDATVRQVATFHRRRVAEVTPVGGNRP